MGAHVFGDRVRKVFVADGDALAMTLDQWRPVLAATTQQFPNLRRTSCYATAGNVLEKGLTEMRTLKPRRPQ